MNRRSYLFRGLLVTLVFAGVAVASYQLGMHRERQAAAAQHAKALANLVADVEYHTSEALAKDEPRQAYTWVTLLRLRAPETFSRLSGRCHERLVDQFNMAMDERDVEGMRSLYNLGREMELNPGLLDALKQTYQRGNAVGSQETGIDGDKGESPFRLLSNS
ncbi:hypothetical protein [Aeoliella sp. SH292]|uniref:hypothetical protein n=1 Tax=Aeoliella sp. SH292 TaxID=3454464 RepID=UPI003F98A88E